MECLIYQTRDISFNTGPREVQKVELIFKESASDVFYIIDSFTKTEQSWADNTVQTIQFSKSKITKEVLSEEQYFRDFDSTIVSSGSNSNR
jgi:hypothetical protein